MNHKQGVVHGTLYIKWNPDKSSKVKQGEGMFDVVKPKERKGDSTNYRQ